MPNLTAPFIVVIDDDARLRDDLVDYLLADGYQAMGFASYEQFLPLAERLQPALVVLDLGLPGLDGMDVCPLLRQRWPRVGVVMLTSRSEVTQHYDGLRAGADAYLVKTASLALVEATVASVLRRLPAPAPVLPQPVPVWTLDVDGLQICTPTGNRVALTVNEFKLVQALLQAQGQCVPRTELLALAGKSDTPVARRNLDAVISRIRAKVRASAHADLPIRAGYATGYAFSVDFFK